MTSSTTAKTTTPQGLLGTNITGMITTSWSLPRTWTTDDELSMFDGLTRLRPEAHLGDWEQAKLNEFQQREGLDDDELRDETRKGLVFWDDVRMIYRGHDFTECVVDSFYSDFEDVTSDHFCSALDKSSVGSARDMRLFNDDERCVTVHYIDSDPECLCGVTVDGIIVKILTLDGTVHEQ